MKNIEQTVSLPVVSLLSDPLSKETIEALEKLAKSDSEESNKAAIEAVKASLKQDEKDQLEAFGVELPMGRANVTMTLGNFLFDLYCKVQVSPQAPLAKYVFKKKILDIAETLDKPEFDIPEEVKSVASKVLNDDKLWSTTNFTVSCSPEGKEKSYFSINHNGANFFPQIINAAVEALANDEPKQA